MKGYECKAVASGDRILLFVRKGERGYHAFSKVLWGVEKSGVVSWYGDVRDMGGREQSGLVITMDRSGAKRTGLK